jgi:hypothetical protein
VASARRQLLAAPAEASPTAAAAGWEQWLAERLEAERAVVLEAVGGGVAELIEQATEAIKKDVRGAINDVLVQVNRAIAELANLRSTLAMADDKSAVIDLPAWRPKPESPKAVN